MLLQAATFDLDDTLWDEHAVLDNANDVFHAFIAQYAPPIAQAYSASGFRDCMAMFQQQVPDKAHDFTFLRKHALQYCMDQVADAHALWSTPQERSTFIEAAFDAFVVARSSPTPFPGVDNMLQDVRMQLVEARSLLPHPRRATNESPWPTMCTPEGPAAPDAVIGVITNGNTRWDLLPRAFTSHFNFRVSAEMVGKPKPEPEIFAAALTRFPAWMSSEAVVHVGDHYGHDIVGAKKAGWRTIWVNRKWPYADALDCAAERHARPELNEYPDADAIITNVLFVSTVIRLWNNKC